MKSTTPHGMASALIQCSSTTAYRQVYFLVDVSMFGHAVLSIQLSHTTGGYRIRPYNCVALLDGHGVLSLQRYCTHPAGGYRIRPYDVCTHFLCTHRWISPYTAGRRGRRPLQHAHACPSAYHGRIQSIHAAPHTHPHINIKKTELTTGNPSLRCHV